MDVVNVSVGVGLLFFGILIGLLIVVVPMFFVSELGGSIIPRFVRVDAELVEEVGEFGCLTSLDLNRDDLWDVVFLSHDCEAMGYMTVPYWQEDEEGNQFFIPVCIEVDG